MVTLFTILGIVFAIFSINKARIFLLLVISLSCISAYGIFRHYHPGIHFISDATQWDYFMGKWITSGQYKQGCAWVLGLIGFFYLGCPFILNIVSRHVFPLKFIKQNPEKPDNVNREYHALMSKLSKRIVKLLIKYFPNVSYDDDENITTSSELLKYRRDISMRFAMWVYIFNAIAVMLEWSLMSFIIMDLLLLIHFALAQSHVIRTFDTTIKQATHTFENADKISQQ